MRATSLLCAVVLAVTMTLALPTRALAMSQSRIQMAQSLYRMIGASSNDSQPDLEEALFQWKKAGVKPLAGVASPFDLTKWCVDLDTFEGGIHPNGTQVEGDYVIYRDASSGQWRVGLYITPEYLLIFDGSSKKFEEVGFQQVYRDDGFLGDSHPVSRGTESGPTKVAQSCRLSKEVWPAGAEVSKAFNSRIAFADPAVVAQDINWISAHPHDTNNGALHPVVAAAGDMVAGVSSVFAWIFGKLEDVSVWLRHTPGPLVWLSPPLALLALLGTSFDGRGIFRTVTLALLADIPGMSSLFSVGESWRFSNHPWQKAVGRLLFHATYGTVGFLVEFFTGLSDSDHVLVGGIAFAALGDATVAGKVGALLKPLSSFARFGASVGRVSTAIRHLTIPFSFAKGLVLVRPPVLLVVGRMSYRLAAVRSWHGILVAAGKADRISDVARATDLLSVGWYRADLFGQTLEWGNKLLHALSASASAGTHIPQLDRMLSTLSQTQRQVVEQSLQSMGRSLAPYSQALLDGMAIKSSGTAFSQFAAGQAAQAIPPYGADGYQKVVIHRPLEP